MRKIFTIIFVALILFSSGKFSKDKNEKVIIVETGCEECQFEIKGNGCHLALRMDDVAYFVDDFGIDDYGDAHGKDEFCEARSRAEVQGKIVDGRFKASSFKLLTKQIDKK